MGNQVGMSLAQHLARICVVDANHGVHEAHDDDIYSFISQPTFVLARQIVVTPAQYILVLHAVGFSSTTARTLLSKYWHTTRGQALTQPQNHLPLARPPCAADVLAVNTNDAFMGIDSESLYSGSKSFPPAFDAGESQKVPRNVFSEEVSGHAFCARYEALACYCCVCRDRSFCELAHFCTHHQLCVGFRCSSVPEISEET